MAFIVEMFWGKPSHFLIQALNDDGELFTESVIENDEPPDPERRVFSCAGSVWERTLRLGEEYGWEPMGTSPKDSSKPDWATLGSFKTDYQPLDWGTIKQVLAEDAASLAKALSDYIKQAQVGTITLADSAGGQVLLRDGMTEEQFESANRGLSIDFLENFVEFLKKGTFLFCWDD